MQACQEAVKQGLNRLEAQMLVLHALGRPLHERAWLLAHDTDLMPAKAMRTFTDGLRRRLDLEPMAYITGEHEFFGLNLKVDCRVLDPRADTEILVEWALECLHGLKAPRLADLGTGSGAIALAWASQRPDAQVFAVDASSAALTVAASNAKRLNLSVEFRQGNWLQPLQGQLFELIASNPPYIADADPHLQRLGHEPREALVSGPQGLDDLQQIINEAPECLVTSGWLLLEHGWDQAAAVQLMLEARGFVDVKSRRDLAGIERCSGAKWPGLR
jgi:release factor glutamine methyltransferase